MKTKFFALGMLAAAAALFSSCARENGPLTQNVTLNFVADKAVATKTSVSIDESAKKATYNWTDEDIANMKLYTVTPATEEAAEKTSLMKTNVSILDTDNTIHISTDVAPGAYTFRAILSNEVTGGGAPKIKTTQTPVGITNYDPNADLLVSDDVDLVVDEGSTTSGDIPLQFRRWAAINVMTLQGLTAGEKVNSVTIASTEHLTGYLRNNSMTGQSKTITLNYNEEVVPADGKFPVYFVTMEKAGHILTVSVDTDQNSYSKSFADGQSVDFQLGKITRFGLAFKDENKTPKTPKTALSLPIEDSMSWALANSDGSAALTIDDIPAQTTEAEPIQIYSAVEKAYKGVYGLKMSSGSANGSITTAELNLSQDFYIAISAKAWANASGKADAASISFLVDGEAIGDAQDLTSDFKTYYVNCSKATEKSTVTIALTKRAYIKDLEIKAGTYAVVKAPDHLKIIDPTDQFSVGEDFFFDGEVALVYNDGSEEALTDNDYTVDANGVEITKAGTYTVTLVYNADNTITGTYEVTYTGQTSNKGLTPNDPFTASEAIDFVKGLPSVPTDVVYYVKGLVSKIKTQYGSNDYGDATFFITDDGVHPSSDKDSFEAYQVYYLNNEAYKSGDLIGIGDEVVVCGQLTTFSGQAETYYNKNTEGARGYLYSLVKNTTAPEPVSIKVSGQKTNFNVGDQFSFGGTVTLVYNDQTESVLTANDYTVNSNAVDMTKAGAYEVTVTYNGNTEIKETYEIVVGSIKGRSADNPYTASEAIEFINNLTSTPTDEEYYVSGIVTRLLDGGQFAAKFGNASFFISDDGTTAAGEFEAYRVLYLGNRKWVDGDEIIGIGDEVVVCGRLTKYNSQPETYAATGTNAYNGYLVSLTKSQTPLPHGVTVDPTTVTLAGTINSKADVTVTCNYDTDFEVTQVSQNVSVSWITGEEGKTLTITALKDGGTEEAEIATVRVYEVGDQTKYADITVKQKAKPNGGSTTASVNFGSAQGSVKIDGTSIPFEDSEGNSWTCQTVIAQQSFTQQSGYSQIGSSKKPATSFTINHTLTEARTINSFSAKFGGFSGTAGNISVKVGTEEIASGALDASNDVVVSTTANYTPIKATAGTVISITVTDIAKGVKAYGFEWSYEN